MKALFRLLIAAFLAAPALAAPGDSDPGFNFTLGGTVFSTAVLPDGKILVGGVLGGGASGEGILLARLHADGSRDATFNPDFRGSGNPQVGALAVQADGKILVAGDFTTVGGSARPFLARLHAGGALDTAFNPAVNNFVNALVVQPDGKILIAGGSSNLSRLNANGTLDATFNPNPNSQVETIALQSDGKILAGGFFTTIGGGSRQYFARLNANGTLDSAFNLNMTARVSSVVVQADGRMVLAGDFATVTGSPRNYLARYNATGTLDSAFNPNPNGTVNNLALQADGRVLVAGGFTAIGGGARSSFARLNANGTLDNTFTSGTSVVAGRVTVQADGKVLLTSNFTTPITRLLNDPATQILSIPSANRVQWLRGGASPEVEQVIFELSTDGGNTYSTLGAGTRIAGGWEKTGLSLPADGEVRARGIVKCEEGNLSSGLVEGLAAFGAAAPEVAVEQPAGTDLADGTSVSFASAGVGDAGNSVTFTIKNTGTASLTDLGLTIDGPDHAMFTVTARPSAPVPGGGSTTFTVRFAPTSTGAKAAALHVANNDSDENAFDLTLTGTGELSTNADLAALSISAGILTPLFTSGTASYAATLGSATSSITVTPTTSGSAATVRVNGTSVSSGSASAPISLSVGENVLNVVVSAGDGVSTKTYTITITRPAPGSGIGDAEIGFDPSFNGSVQAIGVQPDGKVIVVGFFSSVAGSVRNGIARLNTDGTLDSTFDPNAPGGVQTVALQSDGKIVIGGFFTSVGGITRNRIARLHADGTLDTGFNPDANDRVNSVAVQPDGKILLGGTFTTVGGIARSRFARLLANGALDSAFNPNVSSGANLAEVRVTALQANGQILIGGDFFTVGGIPQRSLARLNANGTLDSSYAPNAPSLVIALAVQADGRAIVTSGSTASVQVVRFHVNGAQDVTFVPNANSIVFSLAVQGDGKVLLGGIFTNIGGTPRNRLARFHANGTLDTTFNPDVSGGNIGVVALALQADGRVLAGGNFTSVGGVARGGFARLINDPATESLTIPSPNRVQWLRGGASPEAESVSFELSTDGGNTYSALGAATRIAGGWEKTGLSLPASGEIRARARIANEGDGSGLVETLRAFGSAAPQISLEQPPGTIIANGGSASFGNVPAGEAASLIFTIRNTGTASLTSLAFTKDGPDQAMFTVTANPATPVPGAGGSTTFTVQFAPGSTGSKTAMLHIVGNGSDEDAFDLTLTGTGTVSTNADLAGLSLSAGTLTPAFASATTSYTASAGHNAVSITATPVARSVATVTLNGVAIPSGSASAPISLNVGENVLSIVVTAGDGVSTKTYTVTVTLTLPGTGEVELGFNPTANGAVHATAVQPDGKIVLGGEFTNVGGAARNRIARLHADGALDGAFNPDASGTVNAIAVQADGRMLLGGAFTSVGGITRNRLARLNADGTLDAGFNLGTNTEVYCLAVQADGKIIVGGTFSNFGAAGTRNFIARLNADGSLDAGFNPNANGPVRSVALQADGKIIIGGLFTTVGGTPRSRIARLNLNGSLDTGWNPGASGEVRSVLIQPDGKVIIGGLFTSVGGFPANRVARLNPNGSVDLPFNPNANGSVLSTALQGDGKILLGGDFTTVRGVSRNRIARLNADGTLDMAFDPNAGGTVGNVAQQADGKILVGGTFSTIAGTSRARFVRLGNDPAPQALTASGGERVDWLRGGPSPEIEQVTFELSTDGGNTYSALGAPTRIPGGWERSGVSLPASGHLRARGRTTGGIGNGSSGVVETLAAFASETPEIAVEQPPGNDIADGGSTSFGDVDVGEARSLSFTIKNTGTANLVPVTITKDGADAALFTITTSPVGVIPGGSTSFTVRFAPTGAGARTAALHIASNDGDENPFDLTLTGTGGLSANADLAALSLSVGTLAPVFATGTTEYSAAVPYLTSQVTVTPSAAQPAATIRINGVAAASGSASAPIGLSIGANTLTLVVTAGDGVTTKTYTVAVTRAAPRSGELDLAFDPQPNSTVLGVAVQPDGKIVMGGVFFTVSGQPRNNLARLLPNGALESTATFNPGDRGAFAGYSLAVQGDGKILIGGSFNNPLVRLNPDGSAESVATFNPGTGPNHGTTVALQSDGKIVLVGAFTAINGQPRNRIARLHPNGTLESTATFNPGTGANDFIETVAVQEDGRILLGGAFTTIDGQPRNRIARLNANGTLESTATFNPGTGANSGVVSLAVQPDGKILVGGFFTSINDQPRNYFARLNANGSLESTASFDPGTGANDVVRSFALQADGKILIGGLFTTVNAQPRNRIARLNADGTLESTTTFDVGSGANFVVNGVSLQADGAIVLGGGFASVNGRSRLGIARLFNDAATQSLTVGDSTRVQWMRGGAAPEAEQVTFESSTDGGTIWSPLGPGTRIAGGWERTGLNLPSNGSIRARGRTAGGFYNGSSGLVEQVAPFSLLTPLEEWKLLHLGDANASDLGDPDGDGLRTLAEYGVNSLPNRPDAAPFTAMSFEYPEGERLRVFIQRDPAHNDVTIEVQVAARPDGPWTALAVSALGAPFAGPGYVGGEDGTPGVKTVEIRDTLNIGEEPARFLRVEVRR